MKRKNLGNTDTTNTKLGQKNIKYTVIRYNWSLLMSLYKWRIIMNNILKV